MPRPRSGGPAGGAARESENDPGKKGRSALAELPDRTRIARRGERIRRLRLKKRPCRCRYAVGENEAAGSAL